MLNPAKNTICLGTLVRPRTRLGFRPRLVLIRPSAGAPRTGRLSVGKKGGVLTLEFTVMGVPCLGLNGGPEFKHNEEFSFQLANR